MGQIALSGYLRNKYGEIAAVARGADASLAEARRFSMPK